MSLASFFPIAFPVLILTHFVALLSPGQDFFLIVGHSIRHKLCGSRFICLGIALGNAVYIAIAILGWTGIRDHPVIFSVVEFIGALYLLWIGLKLVQSQNNDALLNTVQRPMPSPVCQLLLGLNSALLNPKNALFYMSLMTVILGSHVTLLQQMSCGVWMFLVVLGWDLLVAATISRPSIQRHLKQSIHLVERGAGIILIFFSIALFANYMRV